MEYSEELQIGYLQPKEYLQVAIQAVMVLKWPIASISVNSIICHTQGINNILGEQVTITIGEQTAIFQSKAANEYYYHENQNKENAERFKKAIDNIISKNEAEEKKRNPLTRETYGALVPSKTYLITPILIYLNVFVYLCMVLAGNSPLSPSSQSLFRWGGNLRPAVAYGEWWRLLTYQFLHAGFLHLLFNMIALTYIGQYLEPLLGKFRFASAYLLTGVCAGLLSISVHANSVGVGSSGAIFGMYGVFMAMLTTNYISRTARITLLRSILFFVVFNLFMGMQGNVDNAAHIGGLMSGIGIGFAYFPGITRRHSFNYQLVLTIILAIIITVIVFATLKYLLPAGFMPV